jgi:hypothetical protein
MEKQDRRVLTVDELMAWAANSPNAVRLHNGRDALPGGLSAAMVPVLVGWGASQISTDDGYYVLLTLNAGGNPVAGTTVLCSAKIPAQSVESVDFVIVPLDRLGKRALIAHAMLRFVFKKGHEIELLTGAGVGSGGDPRIPDLILSWEAWRPPGVPYDALKGLDPRAFDLTLRAYAGAQRFLEDALHQREWYTYTLQLPGGRKALNELLRVGLILGDSVARRSLDRLLQQAEARWRREVPPTGADRAEQDSQWTKLREVLNSAQVPAEPLPGDAGIGYQTLQRSCITMALHMIDVTVERLRAAGDTDAAKRKRLQLGPMEMADWMEEFAHADPLGIFLRAPFALWWLVRHQEVLPRNAVKQLEDAGLLRRHGDEIVVNHYNLGGKTPYGEVYDYLIR